MNTNLLNSLLSDEKLTTQDYNKIKDALTSGKNIFILGKAKTGATSILCNVIDMLSLDTRVIVWSKEHSRILPRVETTDEETNKNVYLTNVEASPIDIEKALRKKDWVVAIDRLNDFRDNNENLVNLFADKETSVVVASIQLPADASTNSANCRFNLKSIMYKFGLHGCLNTNTDILIIQLDKSDGELNIYVEDVKYDFSHTLGVDAVTHFEHHGKDVPQSVIDSLLDPDVDYHEYKKNQGINKSVNSVRGGSAEEVVGRLQSKYNVTLGDQEQSKSRGTRKPNDNEPKYVFYDETKDVKEQIDPTGNMHITGEVDAENYDEYKKLMVTGYPRKSDSMKIVLATGNMNKVREFKEMLVDPIMYKCVELEVVTMRDMGITEDIPENGKSYEINAMIKATYVFNKLGGKHIVIAEDSGFSVEHLGMKPGVESARFMSNLDSNERNQYIIDKLKGLKKEHGERRCHYIAHMIALLPFFNHSVVNASAITYGHVAEEMRGTNGFAYDNIFLSSDYDNRTMAELTNEEKNKISHRGMALRIMNVKLQNALDYQE